jgi:hypothetical protein
MSSWCDNIRNCGGSNFSSNGSFSYTRWAFDLYPNDRIIIKLIGVFMLKSIWFYATFSDIEAIVTIFPPKWSYRCRHFVGNNVTRNSILLKGASYFFSFSTIPLLNQGKTIERKLLPHLKHRKWWDPCSRNYFENVSLGLFGENCLFSSYKTESFFAIAEIISRTSFF